MKTYPAPNCAPESYRAELAKHLHDPWAKGMVDVLWHGTVEYQKFIENDGIEHHRALLAHIRGWRALNRKNVQDGEKAAKTLLADATKKEKQAGQLATMCKPHLQKKIDQLRRDENANRQLAAKNAEAITTLYRKQGFTLEDADARLTAAMIYYMDNPPQRSEAPLPPAPIININVEPTPITVEAIMPAQTEIAITAMPIRKTTTTILRDQAGDIATSVQVESDA